MSGFKNFDGGEPFIQPERPFLLIYTDKSGMVSYSWLSTEEELMDVINEVKGYGCIIQDAIQIGSVRDIKY